MAVTAGEAIAVADLEEAKRLAAEFEALDGGALTMALAQEAEPGGPLRECWLAHEHLGARTNAAAEAAEVTAAETAAAEAAAAEASAALGASAAAEAAAAAGAAAKAATNAFDTRAALKSELLKEPGRGASGMAEDVEKTPGRHMFSVGARDELKTRGGSLSSEGANAAVQAERSTPIKILRSLEYSNALISNTMIKLNLTSEFIFMVNATPA